MSELEQIGQGMEEVPMGQPFPMPPVEIVVHQAMINVNKIPLQNGQNVTLAQFVTPAFTITVKLDDEAAAGISEALRPSPIQIASVLPR
jgi:hypothetical protein